MSQLRINGKIYDWSSVTVNILGVAVVGVQGIAYKDGQEIEGVYGAGNQVVGIGMGNVKCDGKMNLLLNEVNAITKVAPNGRLQEIEPFDIVVSFTGTGSEIISHKLRGVKFMENAVDIKQGDKVVAVEIPLFISFIEFK
jgi:hypothetical protein